MSTPETQQFWEDHYGAKERIWSGRVNQQLAAIVADLSPGRALDLGCGEGGDAMWLAGHGWQVVGVDISPTALERASVDAAERGVAERISFERHDLSESLPAGPFDLVSASFLQSPLPWDRARLLRRAAEVVGHGGRLVIVDHGAAPPWAPAHVHEFPFPTAAEVVDELDLPAGQWQRLRVDAVEREATGPDGRHGTLVDNVIVLQRMS
ncbi:bifunctional 2-polyprenyl-6-hydroxyphenol methylase/3-demethylubiquinol 3-O-methyltransferase UbiG [Mycobacterium sp. 141]|uniref:class I SAM-dependent methyltransferase n=1 Tax=Mycobacterium sp. 141 TaxID=1120797 RepID=UPI00035E069A|nr:class I SAM-dependent methyltransferase [Mycobacterium sp. 141]